MRREITCIICPRGCQMTASDESGELKVTGFTCPKGEKYAIDECTFPVRTVTSSVRVSNREDRMLSVKTSVPVPKNEIPDVMRAVRKITVSAPVKVGEVLASGVSGADIIATNDID